MGQVGHVGWRGGFVAQHVEQEMRVEGPGRQSPGVGFRQR